jgi:hypothetical protein
MTGAGRCSPLPPGEGLMSIPIRHISILVPLVAGALLFLRCSKESGAVAPGDSRPVLTPANFNRVVLTLTGYDTVLVTHELGTDLESPNVVKIALGTKDSAQFRQLLSEYSVFDPDHHVYLIHFSFVAGLEPAQIVSPLTVRYYLGDSSYTDVDTVVQLYRYPYASATLVLDGATVPVPLPGYPAPDDFQDVSRIGTSLFFHPLGPYGTYSYDLLTHEFKYLLGYSGGDHIAAESTFVFCDVNHTRIERYNLTTNTVDLKFPEFVGSSIEGMATYRGRLYVKKLSDQLLKVYAFDGSLIDSIACYVSYYLAIHDSVMYSVVYTHPNSISRYDMRRNVRLSDIQSPSRNGEGMKFVNDTMYYCNYDKKMIGAVPVKDLKVIN